MASLGGIVVAMSSVDGFVNWSLLRKMGLALHVRWDDCKVAEAIAREVLLKHSAAVVLPPGPLVLTETALLKKTGRGPGGEQVWVHPELAVRLLARQSPDEFAQVRLRGKGALPGPDPGLTRLVCMQVIQRGLLGDLAFLPEVLSNYVGLNKSTTTAQLTTMMGGTSGPSVAGPGRRDSGVGELLTSMQHCQLALQRCGQREEVTQALECSASLLAEEMGLDPEEAQTFNLPLAEDGALSSKQVGRWRASMTEGRPENVWHCLSVPEGLSVGLWAGPHGQDDRGKLWQESCARNGHAGDRRGGGLRSACGTLWGYPRGGKAHAVGRGKQEGQGGPPCLLMYA